VGPIYNLSYVILYILRNKKQTTENRIFFLKTKCYKPFKDEAQAALFKDPVRTAQ